jgi:hypothetical protein
MTGSCRVKVFGSLPGVDAGSGGRVIVPFGIYTMEALSPDRYRFSGDGVPTFEIGLTEVTAYMGIRMKVIEGRWP